MTDKRKTPSEGHIFISYAREDGGDLADDLYRDLRADGYAVWRDKRNLNPYGSFDAAIEHAICTAEVVVALITPDVDRQDSFVRLEIAFAKDAGVPIIPIQCPGGTVPITIYLLTWLIFDTYDQCLSELINRLRNPVQVPQGTTTPAVLQTPRERELAYLQQVGDRFERWLYLYTDMAGFAHRERQPQVKVKTHALKWINTEHRVYREHGYVEEGETEPADTVDELRGVVRANRAVLIGEPGSGKTTTLQRLAYEFATAAVADENAPLPVLVPLGAYTGGGLDRHIAAYFGELRLADYLPDRAVVLLDGLNEMPQEYVADVDAWLRRHPETLAVVTCRKLDYAALKALPLRRVDVAPLDVFRIHRFIGNYLEDADRDRLFWALAGDDMTTLWRLWQQTELDFTTFWTGDDIESGHAIYSASTDRLDLAYNQMRAAMREKAELPGLLGLVSNPFLLSIAIEVFVASGQPPRNRSQLFSAFVELLIEKRGKPAQSDVHPWIASAVQQQALAKLAYRMQWEQRGTSVGRNWALTAVQAACPSEDAENLLYLAESATLLTTDAAGEIKFFHQLLQEYFAAYELGEDMRRGVLASKYWPDGTWWTRTGWEETAVLLAGMNPAAAGGPGQVANWLKDTHPVLACRALTEGGAADDGLTAEVQATLLAAMRGDAPPRAREEAGGMINRLGDPRSGVGLRADGLPDIDWVEIPAGAFLMGSDTEIDSLARDNETPQMTVALDSYHMSRYPVTNGQFAAFVSASDGYTERQWWTEAGWTWKGDRTGPDEYGDPAFRQANHPRIYVTWYEAVAYCGWMSARLGYEVRLPTEAEWEKAARGPDGLIYPYGNEFDAAKGNISETGIGQTSAVGIFSTGASPYGLLDMSGNVWEWCMTKVEGELLKPKFWDYADGVEAMDNTPEGDDTRVLRGGAFHNIGGRARCAYRYDNLPLDRYFDLGFRVICVAPVLS